PIAYRNFLLGKFLPIIRRIVAADLLAHYPSGRDAIDGDAVLADLARQTLGPCVDGGLGGEGGVQPLRLGLAGNVDDSAPVARDRLRQQGVRDLAVASEVERDRFVPCAVGCIDWQWSTAAGIVDENVDMPELGRGFRGELVRRALGH